MGLSELRACQSLVQQAVTHLPKLHAWPGSTSAAAWTSETGLFPDDAEARCTPSMRQRIDLVATHGKALRRVRMTNDASGAARSLPEMCPFTLDELLAGDVAGLLTSVRP